VAIEIDTPPIVRGLFKSDIRPGEWELRWFAPCERLSPFVQRLWFARWGIPAANIGCKCFSHIRVQTSCSPTSARASLAL
jgi:hypothetical protein